MKDRWKQEYLQACKEARDQRKADRRHRFIEASLSRPAQMGAKLFPGDRSLADRMRVEIAARRDATPHDPGPSIEQAALHEAGHFVAAEALGMIATAAEIRGSRSGRGGWGGYAGADKQPLHDGGHWGFTADDVERHAIFTLAGLIAEYLFAIVGPFAPDPSKLGDLYSALGEILEVCILAAHLADLRQESRADVLAGIFTRTAQIVVTVSPQIEAIAGFLKSKKSIRCWEPRVKRCLIQISSLPVRRIRPLTAEESASVARIIAEAPMDLVAFTEEVGR